MLEVGDKVESLLAPGHVGTIMNRLGQGWYTIRWVDDGESRGQRDFYRRITEEEYVALVLGNRHGRELD